MDVHKLIARVKALLMHPQSEWPLIAREPDTPANLFKHYVLILAAIPALAGFLRGSVLGYADQYLGTSRIDIGDALSGIVVEYALTLGAVYVLALVIDTTAPLFAAKKNAMQALKLSAYSHTATWVASAAKLLPRTLSSAIIFMATIYGVYLLYAGLPHTMKSSERRAPGYAAVIVIATIFLNLIVATTVRSVTYSRSSNRIVVGTALHSPAKVEPMLDPKSMTAHD